MPNTYTNERMLERYPFSIYADLPFSDSVITAIKLCVPDGVRNVYVSIVEISATHVTVTMSGTVNEADGSLKTITLCMMKAKAGSGISASTFTNMCDYDLSGFLVPGVINNSDIGTHYGQFPLCSGCVTRLPAFAHGVLNTVSDGDDTYATGEKIAINTYGGLEVTGISINAGTSTVTPVLRGEELEGWFDVDVDTSNRITWINEFDVSGGKVLAIKASSPVSIDVSTVASTVTVGGFTVTGATISPITSEVDNVICVNITGGTGFPNCYSSGYDDAGTSDAEQTLVLS